MDDWKDQLAAMLGDIAPDENNIEKDLTTSAEKKEAKKLPKLNYFYEKKGRAGKPATIITGFDGMTDKEVAEIASKLKQRLGCGGSARGGEILLQGDRREAARRLMPDIF